MTSRALRLKSTYLHSLRGLAWSRPAHLSGPSPLSSSFTTPWPHWRWFNPTHAQLLSYSPRFSAFADLSAQESLHPSQSWRLPAIPILAQTLSLPQTDLPWITLTKAVPTCHNLSPVQSRDAIWVWTERSPFWFHFFLDYTTGNFTISFMTLLVFFNSTYASFCIFHFTQKL